MDKRDKIKQIKIKNRIYDKCHQIFITSCKIGDPTLLSG